MEASPSPQRIQRISREFLKQYYKLLHRAPAHLHRFYNNYSTFVHGCLDAPNRETLPVIGQKQIHNRIQQLNFRDCHTKISQVDAQATLGNGVVVQVTGEISNGGAPMRRFTQTFVLAAQSPNKYDVYNEIFRYQMRVIETETELTAYFGEQSSVVINSLQEQLERVQIQLQIVETDRDTLIADICASQHSGEGSSKEMVLNEMVEVMESELQCSICNELFVEPTILNCSHTFCKHCVSIWKETKRDCPVCRASITSECKSLVLESFIEKMVESLSEEMKRKRKEILHVRKGL